MDSLSKTTLGVLLDETAKRHPESTALFDLEKGRRWGWQDFVKQTDMLSRGFLSIGFEPGHHLALWGGSCPEWILTQYAAAKVGAVVISIDPDSGPDQLAYLLSQSAAQSLVMIPGYKNIDFMEILNKLCPEPSSDFGVDRLQERLPHLERIISTGNEDALISWSRLMDMGVGIAPNDLSRRMAEIRPEDVTLISYTSGTTGPPKGVMCTHEGLINKACLSAETLRLTSADRIGLCVPLYHMFGNTCALLTGITQGAALVLFGRHFEVEPVLKGLESSQCTIVLGAPSQFIAMMAHSYYPRADLSRLRGGIMGGAPCPMEVMKKVVEEMGLKEILVGYGQTEASSWITLTRPDDPLEVRVSTIGRPLDYIEVKIIDPQTGDDAPIEQAGELCTRGFLMAGYYQMPAATAQAIDPQGWLHTGDVAVKDPEGNYRILGRIKDLIVKEGLEISPVEIEEVLFQHPGVLEAAVFGLTDQDGRVHVVAWIKTKPGGESRPSSLIEHCRGLLPEQALPTIIHFTQNFPMTATGKIQKFRMRELTFELIRTGECFVSGVMDGAIRVSTLDSL